jgi:G3E family GTPase
LLLRQVIAALNPRAKVVGCSFGQVDLAKVLGAAQGEGVAGLGIVDEHKAAVAAARQDQAAAAAAAAASAAAQAADDCAEPACTDPTHDHSHSSHNHATAAEEAACTDPTHDHSHSSHTHATAAEEAACTDPTHDHSHSSHNHGASATTAAARFGINNFVFSSRRAFAPERLEAVLKLMPTSENNRRALSETLAGRTAQTKGGPVAVLAATSDATLPVEGGSAYPDASAARAALSTVVRSKGFCWLAHSHAAACYWSHSGSHAEVQLVGRWWATVPEAQWPEFQAAAIREDFSGVHGDRRQELVFIGADMTAARRAAVESALAWATLTDAENDEYNENAAVPGRLATLFPNRIYLRPAGPVA